MADPAEYEVTVQLARTAKFRVTAGEKSEAISRVLRGVDGVRSMQDLDDEYEITQVLSVEVVTGSE